MSFQERLEEYKVEQETLEIARKLAGIPDEQEFSYGGITTRLRKEALYDREIIPAQQARYQVSFFQNFTSFTNYSPGRHKQFGVDCNLCGNGGALPHGYRAHIYGISLVPDANTSKLDYFRLYDTGFATFNLTQTRAFTWAAKEIMVPYDLLQSTPVAPVRDMTVNGKPFELDSLEAFGVKFQCASALDEDVLAMVFLWGIQQIPLCG